MDIKALLAKLKAAGKKVDGLGEDALATVAALLEEIVTPIQTKLTETETALKAAVAKSTELEGKVGELSKAAPPAADPKDKGTKKDEPEVTGVLAKISERLESLEKTFSGKEKASAASSALDSVLKAKFPNLKVTERMRQRYLAAGLTEADKIEAEIRADLKDLEERGVKVESLSGDPAKEGATAAPKDTSDKTKETEALNAVRKTSGAGKF